MANGLRIANNPPKFPRPNVGTEKEQPAGNRIARDPRQYEHGIRADQFPVLPALTLAGGGVVVGANAHDSPLLARAASSMSYTSVT